MLAGLRREGLRRDPYEVIESGQGRRGLGRRNAVGVVGQEGLHPIAQPSLQFLDEIGEQGHHRLGDGVEQHVHGSRAPTVPSQAHVFRSLNHGPVGLFNEQRTVEQPPKDDLRLVLPAQSVHEAVASVQEGLMVIQYTRFSSIVNGTDSPNSMERVLHHQWFSLFRDLLVGGVEGHEVNVRLNQLAEEGIDGGNGGFIQPREEHFHVAVVAQPRVKHAVAVFRRGWVCPSLRKPMPNTCFEFCR